MKLKTIDGRAFQKEWDHVWRDEQPGTSRFFSFSIWQHKQKSSSFALLARLRDSDGVVLVGDRFGSQRAAENYLREEFFVRKG